MQIIPDATIADKAYAKDGEAYWQTTSTMNSPLLEQSSNAMNSRTEGEDCQERPAAESGAGNRTWWMHRT